VAETQVRVVFAEARHAFSLDRLECEFALSVADEWRGKGISTLLVAT
jgi:GNAT superfamily N-acetyltransferase